MYKLLLIPSAKKDLDKLPKKNFTQIKDKILMLGKEPRPHGVLKLTGDEGYRMRSGNYRILYRIDDKKKVIYLYRIKHRREVYR